MSVHYGECLCCGREHVIISDETEECIICIRMKELEEELLKEKEERKLETKYLLSLLQK